MATATFTGPRKTMTFGGFTFVHGEARPVPDETAAALLGHGWFVVDGVEEAKPAPKPRRRRKGAA